MNRLSFRWTVAAGTAALLACMTPAGAADDTDALGLTLATEPQKEEGAVRAYAELAVGKIGRRFGLPDQEIRRISLDFNATLRPAAGWRLGFSDRLDDIHPVEPGVQNTVNSLREAYVGWQDESGGNLVDVGRVNLRLGSALVYSPTDYFRDGSIRAVTNVDPIATRLNRMGTLMARAQRLWGGGSVSLVLAPKAGDGPSERSFSPDFGATNHADRGLLAVNLQASEKISGQAIAYYERGKGAQLGANATALVSDAAVAYIDWSGGKDSDLLADALGGPKRVLTRDRFATGITYTTSTRLAVTAELEYNGFAADRARQQDTPFRLGGRAYGAYLLEVQRRQDIASRRAFVLYAKQTDAGLKNLDFTGLLRTNLEDHSRFVWVEARYRLPSFDVALQLQSSSGGTGSEWGALAATRVVQLMGAYYF